MISISKIREYFATKSSAPAETFLSNLDQNAKGIITIALAIGLVAWLPYIEIDAELNPGRKDLAYLRISLSLICLCLLFYLWVSQFRYKYMLASAIAIFYLIGATAYITGSVKNVSIYFGGFVLNMFMMYFAFMPSVPVLLGIAGSVGIFLTTFFIFHPRSMDAATGYMLRDLANLTVFLTVLLTVIQRQRFLAWSQAKLIAEQKIELSRRTIYLENQLLDHEKLAAIGNMAASIVHDFKNPVSIIQSAAVYAAESEISIEDRNNYLDIIRDESARLGEMAQDILDFTRGTTHIDKADIPLSKFLSAIERTISPYFNQKNISFTIDNKTDGVAKIDVSRMLRVFINIAGNAADVLTAGCNFDICVFREGASVIFSCRDNGPGIPEIIIPKLFEPFVTHGKSHGTGLGMAISKTIVEAHGGKIWFETANDFGTTFYVELPA